MTDKPHATSAHPEPAEGPARTLPQFTPVPRLCDRSNGWKPEVQRAFIEALADTGSVRAAARRVGRSEVGAYQLRRHPEGAGFAAAWEVALDLGVRRIEDAAMDRALYGVEVPVLSAGKQFGTRRIYNERLVMFILRSRRPEKYAEGMARGLGAVDRMRMKRMKQAWRAEWDEERRPRSLDEVRDSILGKLEALDRAERARWTPREHELHEALADERAARKPCEEEERRERHERDNPQRFRRIEEEEDEARDACPEPGRGGPPLLEPPAEPEADPKSGPRIRRLKDDEW